LKIDYAELKEAKHLGKHRAEHICKDGHDDRSRSQLLSRSQRKESGRKVMSHIPYYGEDEKIFAKESKPVDKK
jgi:hypothetical protein